MALDKLVDSTQLDSDLTSVANAIRAKSGGSGQLAFPAGFVSEIGNISGGGKEIELLASGTFTKTDYASVPSRVDIPVSFTGTPTQVFVYAPTPISASQSYKWARQFELQSEVEQNLGFYLCVVVYKAATGNPTAQQGNVTFQSNGTILRCSQQSSTYKVQDNTYNWYIWGYDE